MMHCAYSNRIITYYGRRSCALVTWHSWMMCTFFWVGDNSLKKAPYFLEAAKHPVVRCFVSRIPCVVKSIHTRQGFQSNTMQCSFTMISLDDYRKPRRFLLICFASGFWTNTLVPIMLAPHGEIYVFFPSKNLYGSVKNFATVKKRFFRHLI